MDEVLRVSMMAMPCVFAAVLSDEDVQQRSAPASAVVVTAAQIRLEPSAPAKRRRSTINTDKVFSTGRPIIDIERETRAIARKFARHFGWDMFRQHHIAESIRRMLRVMQLAQELGHANELKSGLESRSVRTARRAARAPEARIDTKVLSG